LAASVSAVSEEAVSYRLVPREGRLVIQSSMGEVVPWSCYGLPCAQTLEHWKQVQVGFIKAGVRLFQIGVWPTPQNYWASSFFSMDGKPVDPPAEYVTLDDQALWLIEQNPRSRFIVRFGNHPPPDWKAKHLEQFAPLGDGTHCVNPSLASRLYMQALDRLIRDVVAWCEKQPWRNRIVGYAVFPYGEGATETAIKGELFDSSPVMLEAFREFAREKYRTDEALRRAWGDGDVTLETVRVPTMAEWKAKRDRLGLLHWPDPVKVRRERDYFLFQKALFHRYCTTMFAAMQEATAGRPVLKTYDILKQPMQGWTLEPEFFGTWRRETSADYGHLLLATGSIGVGPLLDHPGMDMLQTPGIYYNRAVGYAWESEGLNDSLVLRGKLNFMEADMRTWVLANERGEPLPPKNIPDAGTFLTPEQMKAGFDRTLAWALSRNQMFYYMSVTNWNRWYHDPVILGKIEEQRRVVEASADWPWRETTDAICLVVDDESPLHEDFSSGYQHLAVFRQLQEGLALCGVPYRIHLLSDLGRDDFPDYKCYLFPNLFRVDDEVEVLLRRRVFRNGHVAIFGPATGITDGQTLTAEPATRLFGVPMELIEKSCPRRVILQDSGHPISRRLPTLTYCDSYTYGPILVPRNQALKPEETSAKPLGAAFLFYFMDRPGLFVNDFGRGAVGGRQPGARGPGDYSVVFSPAVPLPPELLRECCRYAGCNIWSEQNAVIHAAGGFVSLHTVRSGEQSVHLPEKAEVWDVSTGKRISRRTARIEVRTTAPATHFFYLGRLSNPAQ
jgi:hypothetical protein